MRTVFRSIFLFSDDWDGTLGNPGKLGLSLISVVFNTIFFIQHFCLYWSATPPGVRKRLESDCETTREVSELMLESKILDTKTRLKDPQGQIHTQRVFNI